MRLDLFITFFKIGLFTFGGGYAMIPLIEKKAIEEKKWISEDELLEIISISQITPGPIAINAATFIGRKMGGVTGAIAATLGVVLPSLLIITTIAAFFYKDFNNIYIQKIFIGLRAGITAMIFMSVKKLYKSSVKNLSGILIFLITIISLLFSLISPIALILIFGLGSLILYCIFKEKFLDFLEGKK
ncbi:MAG: chromate transporter [Cetobacterium sp.]|uniref:chromate transporter n=1 Tax=unclassified Cetobacterium TaxID=2630983 RepID=UPI00163C0306|nr:chromate transporter [Cetobacterium sp. 2A]MBC2855177.1 chromate transporter [Cetobacterium sp. 2A]